MQNPPNQNAEAAPAAPGAVQQASWFQMWKNSWVPTDAAPEADYVEDFGSLARWLVVLTRPLSAMHAYFIRPVSSLVYWLRMLFAIILNTVIWVVWLHPLLAPVITFTGFFNIAFHFVAGIITFPVVHDMVVRPAMYPLVFLYEVVTIPIYLWNGSFWRRYHLYRQANAAVDPNLPFFKRYTLYSKNWLMAFWGEGAFVVGCVTIAAVLIYRHFRQNRIKYTQSGRYDNLKLVELVTRVATMVTSFSFVVALIYSSWSDAISVLAGLSMLSKWFIGSLLKSSGPDGRPDRHRQAFVRPGLGSEESNPVVNPNGKVTLSPCPDCKGTLNHWTAEAGVTEYSMISALFTNNHVCGKNGRCDITLMKGLPLNRRAEPYYYHYKSIHPTLGMPNTHCLKCWLRNFKILDDAFGQSEFADDIAGYKTYHEVNDPILNDEVNESMEDLDPEAIVANAPASPKWWQSLIARWKNNSTRIFLISGLVLAIVSVMLLLYYIITLFYFKKRTDGLKEALVAERQARKISKSEKKRAKAAKLLGIELPVEPQATVYTVGFNGKLDTIQDVEVTVVASDNGAPCDVGHATKVQPSGNTYSSTVIMDTNNNNKAVNDPVEVTSASTPKKSEPVFNTLGYYDATGWHEATMEQVKILALNKRGSVISSTHAAGVELIPETDNPLVLADVEDKGIGTLDNARSIMVVDEVNIDDMSVTGLNCCGVQSSVKDDTRSGGDKPNEPEPLIDTVKLLVQSLMTQNSSLVKELADLKTEIRSKNPRVSDVSFPGAGKNKKKRVKDDDDHSDDLDLTYDADEDPANYRENKFGKEMVNTVAKNSDKVVCPTLVDKGSCSCKRRPHLKKFSHPVQTQMAVAGSTRISATSNKLMYFCRRTETADCIMGTAFAVGNFGYTAGHVVQDNPTHLVWFGNNEPKWTGAVDLTKLDDKCIAGILPTAELKTVFCNTGVNQDLCVFAYDRVKIPIPTFNISSQDVKLADEVIVWGYHGSVHKVATASGLVQKVNQDEIIASVTTDWGVSGGPWLNKAEQVIGVHYGVSDPNQTNRAVRLDKFTDEKLDSAFHKALKGAKWIYNEPINRFPNGTGPLRRGA